MDQGLKEAGVKRSPGAKTLGERLRWPLLIGGPVIVIAVVAWFVVTGGRYESTDDAYVQASRTPISANVSARVIELDVKDNQHVKKGDVLFRLDPRDFKVAEAQAEAALAAARLQVRTERATAGQQDAAIRVAQDAVDYANREYARQQKLAAGGVASQQQLDQAKSAADEALSRLQVARRQAAAARTAAGGDPGGPVDQHPAVLQAQAALDRAKLQLGYTDIRAPQDGVVTKVEQIQLGSYITAAQPLFWLVSGRPYVEANFKENQLAKMRVGQPAEIEIDAYGGKLNGHVASFSPGAGSTFSILPPQNATGNWVKVVQRLPVRIEFDQAPPQMAAAGLSAKVTVDTEPKR